jgi:hypothetical protein
MSNQILGDSREISNTLDGSQGVIDSQEQYKRTLKDKAYTNEGMKYLGTTNVEATNSVLQVTRTDLNDFLGNAGHFDRATQMLQVIFRRLRHTTATDVNLVFYCNNASNTSINDTDDHYAYARIQAQANATAGIRKSVDSSQYYAVWTEYGFKSGFPNHTLAGTFDIAQLGEQHRNLTMWGHAIYFTSILIMTIGAFNFDHVDDNADDLPAYLNFAPYTGNNAYKNADYYRYPEPKGIVMS